VSGPPSPGSFWRNLRDADLNPPRKALRLAVNMTRRLRGDACCGHPGEPGC
jgi:hypothetical protein